MNSRRLLIGIAAAGVLVGGGGAAWAGGAISSAPSPQPANPHAAPAAPLAPIDSSTESKYTAITPCRIVDTRVAGGKLAANATRSWVVAGTTLFVPQGGTSGGCGVPSSATAVAASVTAVSASGNGYLRIWPYGSAQPNATFMNYTKSFNVSNGGTLTINAAGARHITAKAFGAATHVVIDVSGYYVKPMSAELNTAAGLIHGSRVTNTVHITTGQYEVDFDRNVSQCTYHATPYFVGYTAGVEPRSGNANGVFVYFQSTAGTYTDVQFYLTVTC
ncbi:MAG TPA: hypothetical protein VGL21_12925 [Jatrophihabitantaceae bacterium]|jgi:hypothetical protein